jgi:2,3-bisphosphoglycerate-dependent phosphoglycerate mutase
MTSIYFVRHAEPVHSWKEDKSRPLSEEGLKDRYEALNVFMNLNIEVIYSSPYKRSFDTVYPIADYFN